MQMRFSCACFYEQFSYILFYSVFFSMRNINTEYRYIIIDKNICEKNNSRQKFFHDCYFVYRLKYHKFSVFFMQNK